MDKQLVLTTLIRAIALFTALPVHEFSHAWAASKLGDPTAKRAGRLTLNPFKHLDIIGSVCLLFAGFGWAKPVPVDTRYFRNPRLGFALTSLAGPVSNVIMTFLSTIVYKCFYYAYVNTHSVVLYYLYYTFLAMAVINAALAVFNLLPLPPLDGSRLFGCLLPSRWYYAIMRYERYIFIAVMLLVFSGVLNPALTFLRTGLLNAMDWLTGFVDKLAVSGAPSVNL